MRDRLQRMAARLGAPVSSQLESLSGECNERTVAEARQDLTSRESLGHGWLVSANLLIGFGVLLLVWWIELTMQNFGERMVAAYAVGASICHRPSGPRRGAHAAAVFGTRVGRAVRRGV